VARRGEAIKCTSDMSNDLKDMSEDEGLDILSLIEYALVYAGQ